MLKVTKVYGKLPNTRYKNGKLYKLITWSHDKAIVEDAALHVDDKLILLSQHGMYGLYTSFSKAVPSDKA